MFQAESITLDKLRDLVWPEPVKCLISEHAQKTHRYELKGVGPGRRSASGPVVDSDMVLGWLCKNQKPRCTPETARAEAGFTFESKDKLPVAGKSVDGSNDYIRTREDFFCLKLLKTQ